MDEGEEKGVKRVAYKVTLLFVNLLEEISGFAHLFPKSPISVAVKRVAL